MREEIPGTGRGNVPIARKMFENSTHELINSFDDDVIFAKRIWHSIAIGDAANGARPAAHRHRSPFSGD